MSTPRRHPAPPEGGTIRIKIGPRRSYTDADLELFARYRDARLLRKPAACVGGDNCWIEKGPPAYRDGNNEGRVGCGGRPDFGPGGRR